MATNGFTEARTSISCENIPELFLDKLIAKTHFSQFGKIKRFILRPNRLSCTVEYERPEAAQLAFEKGAQFKNHPFSIDWTDQKPPQDGDNGKTSGSFLDADVLIELEAIDYSRGAPSSNIMSIYKLPEQRTGLVSSNRPALSKLSAPFLSTSTVRTETDVKIGQARSELETLARKPAITAEECYRVLEAKDRYIRLTTERTTDIRKAKNIVGTCDDMCPEKERYLREWKCMVPSYERQPNAGGGGTVIQIDHVKAIKQYSRSSADQELPLPHELRSQQALGRTMHFLLSNLADLCDSNESEGGGNVSDWFHYIWDRTRGVRKDITQQDLCSPEVVDLVEQCTRFHIHCAARLVSEDPSVFDQKINTENMTKCLQSLKYMYTDIAQRGQRCPREAEFRAYMVLLYLNDGNFLWELRQLPATIIHSSELQFALSVYFALEENNFVRFFQLVRSTTYMNACILLRYFTQVRQKALDVVRKAYAVRATASFSLSYMTRVLGFEDEEDAEAFFDHYGITIDRESGMVLFEPKQSMYYQPELPFTTGRAINLVESKRTCSVGEAICGRPLEQWGQQLPEIMQPKNSFDERGCMKEQVLEAVLKGRRNTEQPEPQPPLAQVHEKDPEQETMEDDKTDCPVRADLSVRIEPQPDDRLLFKVPSPTISVPRISPRARTPPLKPSAGLFAEQIASTVTSTAPPILSSASIFGASTSSKTPTVVTSSFSLPVNTGFNNLFGSVKSSNNSFAVSADDTGSKLFGSFGTPPNSTMLAGGNLFGTVTTNTDNTVEDIVTKKYPSPSENKSIMPAGHKRTFFGSTKEPAAPSLSKATGSAVAGGSFFLPKPPVQPTTVPMVASGGSLFGSVPSFGGKLQTFNSTTSNSSSLLAGASFFQQPPMPKNDNNDAQRMVSPRADSKSLAIEMEQKKREESARQELLKQQQKRKEELQQAIERGSVKELEQLLDSFVQESVHEIGEAALTRHKHLQNYPVVFLNEITTELIAHTVSSSAKSEVERFKRLKSKRARQLSKKYFHRWHHNAQSATRWRRLMRTVPPSFINGGIRMDELPPCEQLRPLLNARLTGSQRNANELLQDDSIRQEVFLFDVFPDTKLIDPFTTLEGALHKQPARSHRGVLGLAEPVYWKLAISVPIEGEEGSVGFPSFVDRWLQRCAFRKDEEDPTTASPYFFFAKRLSSSIETTMQGKRRSIENQTRSAICMRLLRGRAVNSEAGTDSVHACNFTNGLLFLLNDRCRINEARNRLHRVIERCSSPPPSIAIILYCPSNHGSNIAAAIDLDKQLGLHQGAVKRWRIFYWNKSTENDTLRSALTFLAHCFRAQLQYDSEYYDQRLEMRPLSDFLALCVGSELWYRLDKCCRSPDQSITVGRNAAAIVQLYNTALDQVLVMVTQDLTKFAHLPKEFGSLRDAAATTGKFLPLPEAYFPPDWHSVHRKDLLRRLLKSLELHPPPRTLEMAIDRAAVAVIEQGIALDVTELQTELHHYLSGYRVLQEKAPHEVDPLAQQILQGIVTQVAGYAFELETRPTNAREHLGRRCYWVPLFALVSETLLRILVADAGRNTRDMLPREVFYRRDEFLHHTETDWWKEQLSVMQEEQESSRELESAPAVQVNQQPPANVTQSNIPDRKRARSEVFNDVVSVDGSIAADGNCSEEDSDDDSCNSSAKTGYKRSKIVNDEATDLYVLDKVIENGMKALVRAEELLSKKHALANELQIVFDPIEKKIQEVEESCRSLSRQHGHASAY
ncbi:uncharacterized protein LOC128723962 [Anopheles nili]|uniref:uncharacterized protein LOC128723962 n=1 Tax=Anopheles nili TaxID=185578 RepID=UPI00237B3B34|nr:uncharacterized protein LOC128723962 [Anopheles nili]